MKYSTKCIEQLDDTELELLHIQMQHCTWIDSLKNYDFVSEEAKRMASSLRDLVGTLMVVSGDEIKRREHEGEE